MTALATGAAALGLAGGVGARESNGDDGAGDGDARTADRGIMFPYQFVPGSAATIAKRDVDWQPSAIAEAPGEYRTHVLAYGFSSSYRAFLFTRAEEELPDDGRFRLGDSMAAPDVDAGRSLVAVDVGTGGS